MCEHCKDWGNTIVEEGAPIIHCPKCNRPTWVNLGVNCPAGMDWDVAGWGHNLMKNIREIFGADYLLDKIKPKPESDKLSDCVKWDSDALQLNDAIISRINEAISVKVKDSCWKNNRVKVTKADVLHALHDLGLYQFTAPDD